MLSACGAEESAEIVLFPGVRYERPNDDDADDRLKAQRHRNEPELES